MCHDSSSTSNLLRIYQCFIMTLIDEPQLLVCCRNQSWKTTTGNTHNYIITLLIYCIAKYVIAMNSTVMLGAKGYVFLNALDLILCKILMSIFLSSYSTTDRCKGYIIIIRHHLLWVFNKRPHQRIL